MVPYITRGQPIMLHVIYTV